MGLPRLERQPAAHSADTRRGRSRSSVDVTTRVRRRDGGGPPIYPPSVAFRYITGLGASRGRLMRARRPPAARSARRAGGGRRRGSARRVRRGRGLPRQTRAVVGRRAGGRARVAAGDPVLLPGAHPLPLPPARPSHGKGDTPSYAAVDRLASIATAKPAATYAQSGRKVRELLGDIAEDLEGSNCAENVVKRIDQTRATLPAL